MRFRAKVYEVVKKISKGKFLSYKEVAKRVSNEKAFRIVGNLMAQNKNPRISCHRVIKNDNEIGGYQGSFKNSWKKAALLLKEGTIGVIPTDTIYGICGSGLNKKTVEKIYHLPECPSYDKTQIDEARGERWFCSEEEALQAGWRKALNCP